MSSRFPLFRHKKAPLILLGASLLVLNACEGTVWPDFLNNDPLPDFSTPADKSNKGAASAPPATSGTTNAAPQPPDPISGAAPFEAKPGGAMGILGLNLDTYFAQSGGDPNTRMDRLEKVVKAMHRDMQIMAPSIQRFAGLEPNLKALTASRAVAAPQPLMENDTAPPPAAPMAEKKAAPAPSPTPKAGTAIKPGARDMAANGNPTVTSVRVGEHSDRVRLVFDVTAGTSYSADLDNQENLLLVELPGVNWSAPMQEPFGKMALMKSYKVDPASGGGYLFVLQLKGPTSILSQNVIPALSGGGKRIVIDLKK